MNAAAITPTIDAAAMRERIAVLERELRERATPPDVARARALEGTLVQVLEWLDALVEAGDVDSRLAIFCDRLAAQIRETLYAPT